MTSCDNGSVFADPSKYEFAPSDIPHFVKWFGWTTPPDHLNNDQDLLDRETWFWVSPDALDALNDSVWHAGHGGEAPILLPEDLPSPDGFMLLSNPLSVSDALVEQHVPGWADEMKVALGTVVGVRWTTLSRCALVQLVNGKSLRERLDLEFGTSGKPGVDYVTPPEFVLRPDSWQTMRRPPVEPDDAIRHTTFTSSDGSPLCVAFPGTQVWQWGRRSVSSMSALCGKEEVDEALSRIRPDLVLPLLGEAPEFREYKRGEPPEWIELPTEDEIREVVALKPLYCSEADALLGKLLFCLWSYAAEPLPPSTPRRIMRDIPKVRRVPNRDATGGIRVMTLREVGESGTLTDDERQGRRRPRRHLVRGHWRNHWHPSLLTHRLKWIAPHLRAGKPSDQPIATETRIVRSVQAPADAQTVGGSQPPRASWHQEDDPKVVTADECNSQIGATVNAP